LPGLISKLSGLVSTNRGKASLGFFSIIIIVLILVFTSLPPSLPIPEGTVTPEDTSPTPTEVVVIPTATITALPILTPTPKPTYQKSTPTHTPSLVPEIGATRISPVDGMISMFVPEGEFEMGSSRDDARAEEKPAHKVFLSAFWIDKTEVTNGMYALCVNAGKCTPPVSSGSFSRDHYFGNPTYDKFPVIWVSWEDANTYCKWAGRRLPTEAEWEKAARANNSWFYPWGDNIDCTKTNYSGCIGDTTMVGSYPNGASSFGVLDMTGNVWEWTSDLWDGYYYQSSPYENPTGPVSGSAYTIRGGSWYNSEKHFIITIRPNDHSPRNNLGFRCLASP
jgi:eukaryotic-like serine/threonine-protein kinase